MSRIAIDMVLLPDEEMSDRAIELNRELVPRYGDKIVLNKATCLPHISLAMGCIDEGAIDSVGQMLQGLASETFVKPLRALGIATSTNSRGEQVSAFEIEKTGALQRLHERVMQELGPLLGQDVTAEMFYDDGVAETALEWVRHYREKSGFASFWPHITIGYGRVKTEVLLPMAFEAPTIALCHLGDHCTCRRVLASASTREARDASSGR